MIKTKNLDDLLNKESARSLFLKYQGDCHLSKYFQIIKINRQLVLSPQTYALCLEIDDQGLIRKIRANASREESRLYAYQVMKFLQSRFEGPRLFIPRIYFYDSDYNLLVYENIEGQPLIDQLKSPDLESKIQLAGQWLHRLHSNDNLNKLDLPSHKTIFNFKALARFYPELSQKGPANIEKLESKLSSSQKKLIHGDYQPNNMIINKGKIFVYDFNASEIADPVWDLARFLSQLKVMLFRFADASLYENLENVFLANYGLQYSKDNLRIYLKICYLQILCTIAAALSYDPGARATLSAVYSYHQNA